MSMLLFALLPPLFPLQVEDSSLDFVEIGGSTTPGLTVTQGADLLVSLCCLQLLLCATCNIMRAAWKQALCCLQLAL